MMMNMALKADPYATKVLNPDVHERLVKELVDVCRDASIQPSWVWTALADTGASQAELEYVRRFKFHSREGLTGLALIGGGPSEDRMAAMAGALIRNFIRPQVIPVLRLLEILEEGGTVDPTCLMIPNFFVGKAEAGAFPAWKVAKLYDLLLERHMTGMQTVIYVSDMKKMDAEYGGSIGAHIAAHFYTAELGA
jgi:hypothetical protein